MVKIRRPSIACRRWILRRKFPDLFETENNCFSIVCFGSLDYYYWGKCHFRFLFLPTICFWQRWVFVSQRISAQILQLLTTIKLLGFRKRQNCGTCNQIYTERLQLLRPSKTVYRETWLFGSFNLTIYYYFIDCTYEYRFAFQHKAEVF